MARDDLVIATEQTAYKIFPSTTYPGEWRVFEMWRIAGNWQTARYGGRRYQHRFATESEARAAAERYAAEYSVDYAKGRQVSS